MKLLRALKMKHQITTKKSSQVHKTYSPSHSVFKAEKKEDSFGENQDLIEDNLFMKVILE